MMDGTDITMTGIGSVNIIKTGYSVGFFPTLVFKECGNVTLDSDSGGFRSGLLIADDLQSMDMECWYNVCREHTWFVRRVAGNVSLRCSDNWSCVHIHADFSEIGSMFLHCENGNAKSTVLTNKDTHFIVLLGYSD